MLPIVNKTSEINPRFTTAYLIDDAKTVSLLHFEDHDKNYIVEKLEHENDWILYKSPLIYFFFKTVKSEQGGYRLEEARKAGSKFYEHVKKENTGTVQISGHSSSDITMAFLEGFLLSTYNFTKYKKDKNNYYLFNLLVGDEHVTAGQIREMTLLIEAVFFGRDLVNEPLSYLTAECLSQEIEARANKAGFTVEVFNRKKIEALRMGGLLAVNKGSVDPPTFTIMEWKPQEATNEKPIVLVGKGVVYDTGGLSLKPTPKSMDYMKSDMAGGAVVAAAILAAATNKLPVHLIGLIPATDNRPHGNAYVPGDVITMFDGTTVEIKNTDAEGRLLLADALSYARKFDPLLVVDVATLTGSAEIITGPHGLVAMGNSPDNIQKLRETGENTFERIVEVPLWDEFAKPLKSNIADLNNLGLREGQTSIAGKFLEHFISYPWIHLDIAAVAWLHEKDAYLPAGGTGFGIRLLYNFLKLFN